MAVEYIILLSLALAGCALGSFAGASVWRLRSRQLVQDMRDGEAVNHEEYASLLPLSEVTIVSDRSRCLHCGHVLAWYDLIPLLSWLSVAGKCRYCKQPIGLFEPLMEVGTASAFVLSYMLWPLPLDEGLGVVAFILWLIALVLLAILFAYDYKWFLLPDVIMFPLIGVGLLASVIRVANADAILPALMSLGGAVIALSGLYYSLWLISKGQWVGFGDVKLGLALALLLGDWQLALLALFLANLIGTVIVIPGMLLGRIGRKAHVPFGPLLIAGTFIAMLVGEKILSVYLSTLF